MLTAAALVLFIGLAIVTRLVAGYWDRVRIDDYFRERSCILIGCDWDPFGPGSFGSKERIYKVRYRDEAGHMHQCHIKTALSAGVYSTEDRIIDLKARVKSRSD
ncbi:MAG: hypothetical protein RL095_3448 [Verrucomicrobiota bacterium]|jgi:hypothetical protein